MRLFIPAMLCVAGSAWADPMWAGAHGRVTEGQRIEVFAGPGSAGASFTTAAEPRAAWAAEFSWGFAGRTGELRGAHLWQLNQTGFATVSAQLGVEVLLVPVGGLDLGAGPQLGLTLSLGGRRFNVDVGAQLAVEAFVISGGPRVPLRAVLGLNGLISHVSVAVMARAGVDVEAGRPFVGRAEVVVALGWVR